MNLLGMADPTALSSDALTGLAFGIIKILAFGAMGVVVFGVFMSLLCDLFECRKWRHVKGRTETWQLMH